MKKLFGKSFLALALAMTMLMGMSMTAMAGQGDPFITLAGGSANPIFFAIYDGVNLTPLAKDYIISEKTDISMASMGQVKLDGTVVGNTYTIDRPVKVISIVIPDSPSQTNPCVLNLSSVITPATPASSSHTHNYEWNTLVDPTTEQDGVEAYICSCGDIQATQPISAAHNILKSNADAVKNAKAGATVVVELGRLNSLPRWFVTKLVERDDLNVTLKITYNHQNYTLEIPKTATIEDESIEWYGPLKLLSMFPQK